MRRTLHALCIMLCCSGTRAQHNSDFMQYMFNGLLINPAYAGSSDALNITALYRNQWLGLPGAPVTAVLSAHAPMKNKRVNVGGILFHDRFGVYDHSQASVVYAYRIKLASGQLAFGLQGGIDTYFNDWTKINTGTIGDPNFQNTQSRKIGPQAGAGLYFRSSHFYLGASAPNLINYNMDFYKQQLTMLNAGGLLNLNESIILKPALLFKYISNSPLSANISTTFYYKNYLGIGIGYTHQTAAMVFADIRVNEQLNFGYGYTYALNQLKSYSSGSHELMLRYLFRYKINGINPRYF
jgi:type IX secretion system PorP/SprF family membrane protein